MTRTLSPGTRGTSNVRKSTISGACKNLGRFFCPVKPSAFSGATSSCSDSTCSTDGTTFLGVDRCRAILHQPMGTRRFSRNHIKERDWQLQFQKSTCSWWIMAPASQQSVCCAGCWQTGQNENRLAFAFSDFRAAFQVRIAAMLPLSGF